MEFSDFLRMASRSRVLIMGTTIIVAGVVVLPTMFAEPIYEARIPLRVLSRETFLPQPVLQPPAEFYVEVLRSPAHAAEVVDEFGLLVTAQELLSSPISVDVLAGTTGEAVIVMRVSMANPDSAAAVANRLAELAVERIRAMELEELRAAYRDLGAAIVTEPDTETWLWKLVGDVGGSEKISGVPALTVLALLTVYARALMRHAELANALDNARGSLQVISPAFPPDRALPRQWVLRTVVGLALGFVLSILLALVRETITNEPSRP